MNKYFVSYTAISKTGDIDVGNDGISADYIDMDTIHDIEENIKSKNGSSNVIINNIIKLPI